jgi:hypothetical protein
VTGEAEARQVLLDFVRRYGPNSPLGELAAEACIREVFGIELDEAQVAIARAFSRGERLIAARSCHGIGKTTIAALLAWVHLLTRFPQKTAVTAPSKGQLEGAFFAELSTLYKRMAEPLRGLYEIKKNHVELKIAPEESFLDAKTARKDNPEAIQGIHSANVFVVADEASGVDDAVFAAGSGSMSGENATTLLLGNPTRTSGFFYDAFHRAADLWVRIHATAVPNTPGIYSSRVSPSYVEMIARIYGRDSNEFRIRCLGEFPLSQDDTIIPSSIVCDSIGRDIIVPKNATEIWGLDVAWFGGDDNVLLRRNKLAVLPLIQVWSGVDLMKTTYRLKQAYDAAYQKPEMVLIDEIGYGAGVLDRARELGLPARGVNVSIRQGVGERYYNLRTQLWYQGRQWLEGANRRLPERCTCGKCDEKDDHVAQLTRELTSLRYDYTATGQLIAEPKKAYRKRTQGRSPNIADAFLLTLSGEVSTLMHGSKHSGQYSNPNEPLRRKRAVV